MTAPPIANAAAPIGIVLIDPNTGLPYAATNGVVKLGACAIPFIISPSGSMANNGALTLGTAIPNAYANAYIYLPAGAIAAGSAAGWYYASFSTTLLGTVFNNTYTSGQPTIPASPTAFVTTGPGAYTGVLTAVTGPQITIPAGSLGANGVLRITEQWSCNNSAGAKTLVSSFSGSNVKSVGLTTSNGYRSINTLQNRGIQAAQVGDQVGLSTGGVGILTGNNEFFFINFAVAQTYQMIGTLAVATDVLVMEAFFLEAIAG